jgi:membrane associated rhomboid family serine protease
MFPLRDSEPSYTKPVVTMFIIAVNLLVFLFEASLDPYTLNAFIAHYGLIPAEFHASAIFTSMFVHGGWLHVLGNMWFLWIFGNNIEDILGHEKYLIFYIMCGVAAAVTQTYFNLGSQVPMVGASGAIAGVMGAYLIKFPHARIRTLFFFIFIMFFDIPAWVMLVYWFAIQFFSGIGSIAESTANSGGTAFFAHVGGFLAGILLVNLLRPRQRYVRRWNPYQ